MGWSILHRLFKLTFPGGLFLVALGLLHQLHQAPGALAKLEPIWAPALFAAALLLAVWFHQIRVMMAILLFALVAQGRAWVDERELRLEAGIVIELLLVLLALNLLWVAFLRARGRLSWRSSSSALVLLAQAGLLPLFLSSHGTELQDRFAEILGRLPQDGAHAGLLLLILPTLVLLVRTLRDGAADDRGLLWSTVAVAVALTRSEELFRTLFLCGAGAILILTVLESSYRMAYRDELTGLPSRRALSDALANLGETYSVALVDIDHFKRVNDRYGHDVGDQVLCSVATHIGRSTGGGRAFRYGGEEFALLFTGQTLANTLPHLEGLRATIESSRFTLREPGRPRQRPKQPRPKERRPRSLRVTVSVGAAERSQKRPDAQSVIKAADQALYRAKRAGRNQVKK